jgi:hypothetical protein
MLRKAKLKLLVITLACVLCLTLIPRATASHGEVNSFLRNPHSNASFANWHAAFVLEDYPDRIISYVTCTPLCWYWLEPPGDANFNGDEHLGIGHSYFWLVEEIDNFSEHKKWVRYDFRVVFYLNGEPLEATKTPLVYAPHLDLNSDGILDPSYTFRVGSTFRPGELAEGVYTFNWKVLLYNHDTGEWDEDFDYVEDFLGGFQALFWIYYN